MGLGVKASFQTLGIFKESIVDVTWAYWMHVYEGASLSLGASMGFAFSHINSAEVRTQDINDQALYKGNISSLCLILV